MGNNIVITSTSFLLPKNEAWNNLGAKNKLIFSDYGDWRNSIVKCEKDKYLIFLIFGILHSVFSLALGTLYIQTQALVF